MQLPGVYLNFFCLSFPNCFCFSNIPQSLLLLGYILCPCCKKTPKQTHLLPGQLHPSLKSLCKCLILGIFDVIPAAAAKSLQSCPTLCDQPTRLPHPWDSPGKNTGVGCHFLLQCMKVKSESEVTQSCRLLSLDQVKFHIICSQRTF